MKQIALLTFFIATLSQTAQASETQLRCFVNAKSNAEAGEYNTNIAIKESSDKSLFFSIEGVNYAATVSSEGRLSMGITNAGVLLNASTTNGSELYLLDVQNERIFGCQFGQAQ